MSEAPRPNKYEGKKKEPLCHTKKSLHLEPFEFDFGGQTFSYTKPILKIDTDAPPIYGEKKYRRPLSWDTMDKETPQRQAKGNKNTFVLM